MSKRFTDTSKWIDPWFSRLRMQEKLFWLYILDNCDHAGIWKANWKNVKSELGTMPILKKFKGRVFQITEEKFFIPKFLIFQYGPEWWESRINAHQSAVKILKSLDFYDKAIELTKTCHTLGQGLTKTCLTLMDTATATDSIMDTDMTTDTVTDTAFCTDPLPNARSRKRVSA